MADDYDPLDEFAVTEMPVEVVVLRPGETLILDWAEFAEAYQCLAVRRAEKGGGIEILQRGSNSFVNVEDLGKSAKVSVIK